MKSEKRGNAFFTFQLIFGRKITQQSQARFCNCERLSERAAFFWGGGAEGAEDAEGEKNGC